MARNPIHVTLYDESDGSEMRYDGRQRELPLVIGTSRTFIPDRRTSVRYQGQS